MSATLTATVESLHIAAAQKLMELLQTEKDPSLLARLIATALRFKLPKLPGGSSSPAPQRKGEHTNTDASRSTPPPRPYTDEEYGNLVVRYGEDKAADLNDRREALIARHFLSSDTSADSSPGRSAASDPQPGANIPLHDRAQHLGSAPV